MSLEAAFRALDDAISDDSVEVALRQVLRGATDENGTVQIELGEVEGGYVGVPVDVTFEIVTKAFFKECLCASFGDFRVQVALGGALVSSEGTLTARLCFATLFFNAQGQRFTIDFHIKVR
jgi:hypothetical protein